MMRQKIKDILQTNVKFMVFAGFINKNFWGFQFCINGVWNDRISCSLDSFLPSRAMLGLLPKASKCLGWKMVIYSITLWDWFKCLFSSRFIHPNFQLRRPRAFDAYPQFVPCIKLCSIRLLPDSAVSCPKAREEKREVGVLEIWCRVERTGIRWEPEYRMCKICIIFSGLNWWGKTYRFPFLFGRILIFRRGPVTREHSFGVV